MNMVVKATWVHWNVEKNSQWGKENTSIQGLDCTVVWWLYWTVVAGNTLVRYRIVNQTPKESNTTASGTGEKNYNESLNIL